MLIKQESNLFFLEVETIDKDNHNNHSISYKELLSKINQIEEIEFQKKE